MALKNNGSNYATWKYRISRVLKEHNLWKHTVGLGSKPDLAADPSGYTEWQSRDEEAVTQITLTLEDEPLSSVMHLSSAQEVWDKLTVSYKGKGKQTVASLIGELFREMLCDESPLRPQLDAMLNKKHLLTSLGQSLDDSLVAIAMVISLPPSYSTLRTILMFSEETLSTDKVIASVVEHEKMRLNEVKQHALAARLGKGAPPKQDSKAGSKKGKSDKPKCAHCKKLGHKKEECRKLKAELEAKQKEDIAKKGDLNAKVATVRDDDTILRIYVADVLEARKSDMVTRWIVDSGASAHMSSQRNKFCSYRALPEPRRVWLGDEWYNLAMGTGSMYLDMDDCTAPILLTRVFYVPELHGNLLSVSQLVSTKLTIKFVNNGCHVLDNHDGATVGTASLRDGLYVLNGHAAAPDHAHVAALDHVHPSEDYDPGPTPDNLTAFVANTSKATVDTWHNRLVHLSVEAVLRMVRSGMVEGMSIIGESKPPKRPCSTCMKGKQTCDPIPKVTTSSAPRPNYRISSDLMESDTLSPHGEKYLDTYINQHSRHISA